MSRRPFTTIDLALACFVAGNGFDVREVRPRLDNPHRAAFAFDTSEDLLDVVEKFFAIRNELQDRAATIRERAMQQAAVLGEPAQSPALRAESRGRIER